MGRSLCPLEFRFKLSCSETKVTGVTDVPLLFEVVSLSDCLEAETDKTVVTATRYSHLLRWEEQSEFN
jgi:hypothetical protein